MKEKYIRVGVIILLALVVQTIAWYFLSGVAYLLNYGIHGAMRYVEEFATQPAETFSYLVGSSSNAAVEKSRGWLLNPWIQLAFWGWVGYEIFRIFRPRRRKYEEAANWGSHGTARWATSGEIRELQKDQKGFVMGEYQGKPVVHPLKNPQNLNSNIIVIGGSGSAKTSGYVIPNVLHIAENLGHSMFLTDIKGEIYNTTSQHLRDLGYKVFTFNLLDQDKRRSDRYNPMKRLKRDGKVMTDEVMELADQIMESTGGMGEGEHNFFAVTGRDLLVAMMLYVLETRPEEEHHLRNVLHIVSTVGKDPEKLRKLFEELPSTSEARAFFDNVDAPGAEKQWEGVRGEMRSRLGLWNLNSIAELTADSDFDFTQMGMEKTVLYLMIPDASKTYNILPTLLIDQAFKELIRLADTTPKRRLPIPTWFILDELGNIARVKDLDVRVNTIRSRGIQFVGIFQNFPQFEEKYGRLGSKSIDSSCDTKIYLGTGNDETNERISRSLGTTTIKTMTTSRNEGTKSESSGVSESYMGRRLMYPDEVAKIRETNELIVLQQGKPPMLLTKHMYFKQEKWKAVLGKEVDWQEDISPRGLSKLYLFSDNASHKENNEKDLSFLSV